ncbi:hypothetical protein FJR11_01940 [Anabaena sp. UHCC 0187]|nr:hypothetical protein [Anabaena sp. UHCC 0187]
MGETLRFFPHSSAFLLSVVSCQLFVVSCQLFVVRCSLLMTNLLLFAKVADLSQQLYLKFNYPETGVV